MIIKTKNALTIRDTETGELTSFGYGQVANVSSDLGNSLIADGLAEVYSPVDPSGSQTITANGTYDVTLLESVTVDVDVLTVTYNVNGGTGSVDAVNVASGDAVTLDDGSDITAPEGKEFKGWATADDAETPDVESPYTPTESVTLYAVYGDAE